MTDEREAELLAHIAHLEDTLRAAFMLLHKMITEVKGVNELIKEMPSLFDEARHPPH
jgi:hypothetical protein